MTKYLGLLTLILAMNASADTSTMLVLRAVVPEVSKIEMVMEKDGPRAIVKTNSKRSHFSTPKFLIKKHPHHYLVSVTQN